MADSPPDDLLDGFSPAQPYTREVAAEGPRALGVHVVLDGDEIVYVGNTTKQPLRDRLRQHLTGNRGSSALHKNVGRWLDEQLGREASADEIADWLGGCEVRWRETDDPDGLKDALLQRVRPRFNRQLPGQGRGDDAPTGGPADWIYPVNERGPQWGDDRSVWEYFTTTEGVVDWQLASSYHQIAPGDRIWAYATEPIGRLVAGGVVWDEPYQQTGSDKPEWRVPIRWDHELTRFLLADVHAVPGVLATSVRRVRGMRPEEAERLAAVLDGRRAPEPEGLPEGRRRRLAEVTARQGQPGFRRRLIEAYGGRCAITGCDTEVALQAAHISPYDGPATNRVTNGLLLRADLHNLFDRGVIWVDEQLRVRVKAEAAHYAEWHGERLRPPARTADRPDAAALRAHRREVAGMP
ncbi:HNH endonuclease [Micromonospora sp. NPDC023814]|uniref:HNH endonuclease n=1 Tax=Micromonospora sp. NPDC023814 TaxID=3154596 RepID=UPI0033D80FD8